METVIIANITWNPDGWRNIYINPKAGHRYARESPGHESLNFLFNKMNDINGRIHGYVQWTNPPKKFEEGGIIVFYSHNSKTGNGEIVGIYGNARIIKPPIKIDYKGFENNQLVQNIEADEKYSMLFPIPLSDEVVKKALNLKSRLVPQVGFRKIEQIEILKVILREEILQLKRSGIRLDEQKKIESIYEFAIGESYDNKYEENIQEQEEILDAIQKNKTSRNEIINELKNLKPTDSRIVILSGKTYSRDSKTLVSLKILREFKCQMCGVKILKKNGGYYIEAAHIIPKRERGAETPDNIMILCPNHHKEYDYGHREEISRDKDQYTFRLNGVEYTVDLMI